eukprot:m.43330 g.43330  ORF g.43330 m.43330 type:complete len:508 (+) comp46710_c0_seq1:81-1604(+)
MEGVKALQSWLTPLGAGLKETSWSRLALYAGAASAGYLLFEQASLKWRGRSLPGPSFVPPLLGGIVDMVLDAHNFWEKQRLMNPTGLSWNSIIGIFMVYSAKMETTTEILKSNGPDSFILALHPNGVKVFGEHNIAFKYGEEHIRLRRSFLNLFTRKALGCYLAVQNQLIRESIAEWLKQGEAEHEIRLPIRDMNVWTSQKVFCGPYIRGKQDRDEFSYHYQRLVDGFLSFPLYFPGTGLWKAVKSRHVITETLTRYCAESKVAMREKKDPSCLLDFWTQVVLEEIDEVDSKGLPRHKHHDDLQMGYTMMDFLFAAQDASTASLTWIFALMSEYPEVLKRVREEQFQVRPNDEPVSAENIEQMVYTRAVVKEILRFRPPASFVPQVAAADVELEGFKVKKGTLVIPSLWAACRQGFPDAEKFDPDRMMPDRAEDSKYRQYFLTFGVGPHMCVGREYATNHLIAFLAILSMSVEWTRRVTAQSSHILFLPTIYPADCLVSLKPRAYTA